MEWPQRVLIHDPQRTERIETHSVVDHEDLVAPFEHIHGDAVDEPNLHSTHLR
jgi:hypothetical protein